MFFDVLLVAVSGAGVDVDDPSELELTPPWGDTLSAAPPEATTSTLTLEVAEATKAAMETAAVWWDAARAVLIPALRGVVSSPPVVLGAVRYADWRIVFLVVAVVVMASAKIWGIGGGVVLTRYLRKPMAKLGMNFKALSISLLRFHFKLEDVEILPYESDAIRGIFLAIYPSADVVSKAQTPKGGKEEDRDAGKSAINGASFPGSRIFIESISVRFSLRLAWFDPGSYLADRWPGDNGGESKAKKEGRDAADSEYQLGERDEEKENGAMTTNVEWWHRLVHWADFLVSRKDKGGGVAASALAGDVDAKEVEEALPEAMRPWYRRLALCGPLPKITVELRGLRIEIDKVYLAPPPPPGIHVPAPPPKRYVRRSPSREGWGRGRSERGSLTSMGSHLTTEGSSKGSEHIVLPPAALVPTSVDDEVMWEDGDWDEGVSERDFQAMLQLPHFHQETFLSNMEGAGAAQADSITFFIERWLDYTKKNDKKDGGTGGDGAREWGEKVAKGGGGDVATAAIDSSNTPDIDDTGMEGESSSGAKEKKDRSKDKDDTRNDDRTNALFRSVFHSLLSSATLVAYDCHLIVTGADGDTVKRVRAECHNPECRKQECRKPECRNPRFASVALARLPQQQRASASISLSCLKLRFQGSECDAVVSVENFAAAVQHPGERPAEMFKSTGMGPDLSSHFRKSEVEETKCQHSVREEARDCQELIPPHDALLEIKGVLPFLIYCINYDHRWEHRQLEVSMSLPERTLCVAPRALHTFMAIMDDFVDPLSPFREWHMWLSKARLESVKLNDEEHAMYREFYLKAREKKKTKRELDKDRAEKKGSSEEHKSNRSSMPRKSQSGQVEATIASLEKRMTRDEIIEQRCLAMRKVWRVDPSTKELADFLRSTESRIIQATEKKPTKTAKGDDQEHGGATLPFQRTYTSPLEALAALVQEKFNLLAASLSISIRSRFFSVQLINDGSFESRADINTVLTLESIEMCIEQSSPIFSPKVLRHPQRDGSGSIDPMAPSTTAIDSNIRQTMYLTLTIQSAMWIPIEIDNYPGLPSFLEGSLLGLLYKPESSGPGPMLNISMRNGVSLSQSAFSSLDIELDDIAVVFNPAPLFSALAVLVAASELPARDINDERESYSLPRVEKGGANNGTLLNGAKMSVFAGFPNISLVIPLDTTNLHKGCLEINAHRTSILLDSRDYIEFVKFDVSSIRSFSGRAYGTNDKGGRFLINRLPFKQAFSVEDWRLQYKGEGLKKEDFLTGQDSAGKETTREVGINLVLTVGKIEGYSSPSITVKLLSAFESLNKSQEFLGGDDDEELTHSSQEAKQSEDEYRLEALRELWKEADADGSKSLDRDELEEIILRIFNSTSDSTNMFLGEISPASRVTHEELQREVRHFLSLADPHRDNDISFQEMKAVVYRKEAQSLNNTSPSVPKSKNQEIDEDIDKENEFQCSYEHLCGLLYFDDLREYASIAEVYRITGSTDPKSFLQVSQWRKGEGISLFWELYERETGCTKNSLNGQDMLIVQQKLVRVLLNYEFTKFVWKSLVGPGLREAAVSGKAGTTRRPRSTDWALDNDPKATAMTLGVVDHLVRHIQQRTSDMAQELKDDQRSNYGNKYIYNVHVQIKFEQLSLGVGNGLACSRPLIAARAGPLKYEATALLQPPSQGSLFVAFLNETRLSEEMPSTAGLMEGDRDSEEHITESNNNNASLELHQVRVRYLNMTHDTEETTVEPFDILCLMSYKATSDMSGQDGEKMESTSTTLEIFIPKFINVNVSPAFLATSDLVNDITGDYDIQEYEQLFLQRHLTCVREYWAMCGKNENQELTLDEMHMAFENVLDKSEGAISRALSDDVTSVVMRYVDTDASGTISWAEIERCVMSHILVFNPILTRIHNRTGFTVHYCPGQYLGGLLKKQATATLSEIRADMLSILDGRVTPVQLYNSMPLFNDNERGKLVLLIPGCKILNKVPLSSYQSQMFRLKPLKRGQQRYRRGARKKQRFGTGFDPYLTVVATSDKIDAITYSIRSSIVVKANTPIDIRVVCLPKSLPLLRRRKSQNRHSATGRSAGIDLSKKNFASLLEKTLDGAPIIYEKLGNSQGSDVPLPIEIFLSSSVHALFVRDLTGEGNSLIWRKPVLLTKDFLLNTGHISEVVRSHAISGITVRQNRLNVYRSDRSRQKVNGDVTKSSTKTAWDVQIEVHPSFALMNSLPFPIQFQAWQDDPKSSKDEWKKESWMVSGDNDAESDSDSSGDNLYDDSVSHRRREGMRKHMVGDSRGNALFVFDRLSSGGTVRLNGVSMSEVLYFQVSQDCGSSQGDLSKLIWSAPFPIALARLRTGGKRSGSLSLPHIQCRLGDMVDVHVNVTVERDGSPFCTLFAPYWVSNKTGMKLLYKLTGREAIYDAGVGGIPILASCKVTDTPGVGVAKREIAVMPLEGPKADISSIWWDDTANGTLITNPLNLKWSGKKRVKWSDEVGLDQAGTSGEINCRGILFGVSVESLTGVFHRSNLVNIGVRYVAKNILNIPVTIIPMVGSLIDIKKEAKRLREDGYGKTVASATHSDPTRLEPSESTIIYYFRDMTPRQQEKDKNRFICVCIEAARCNTKAKWHIIPVDVYESTYYTEFDGWDDRLSGMVKVEVKQQGATIVLSIVSPSHPPFKIENRSTTHYLQFVQDDRDGVVIEIPPLSFTGYAWCNPMGKKRLRFVAVEKGKSKESLIERRYGTHDVVCEESDEDDSFDDGTVAESQHDHTDAIAGDDQGSRRAARGEDKPLMNIQSQSSSPFVIRRRLFSRHSRSYDPAAVGRQQPLPGHGPVGSDIAKDCKSNLVVEVHVLSGTRIMSFSESEFRFKQIEAGLLRSGGSWKNTQSTFFMAGFAVHLTDDFPHEVMSVLIRELSMFKLRGHIQASMTLRHLQVDAMFPSAKYPVMLRPVPMGVDRRNSAIQEAGLFGRSDVFLGGNRVLEVKDQFWKSHNEKPIPVVEATITYLPQLHMTWIPKLKVILCPLKMQIELDFCLRLADLVIDSLPEPDESETDKHTFDTLSRVDKKVKYETGGSFGSKLTYIEDLSIEATWLELDLEIKARDEDEGDGEGDTMLALSSIGRSTKSQLSASLLSWLGNVASAFARVSPKFKFNTLSRKDQYCNVEDLLGEIQQYYKAQCIYQSYKVFFSMHLLGSPTHYFEQLKVGSVELVTTTRDEMMTGGKDGYGKGFQSFFENVIGGTFTFFGKATGSIADVLDSATTNEYTSKKMKPKSPATSKTPSNVVEGFTHGTIFLGKAVIHGMVGVVGNPYRGLTEGGSATSFAKGIYSGTTGLMVAPFVGALGFTAKITGGTGEMTKITVSVIEARCRPLRVVRWGASIGTIELTHLKAIGIRIHSVRYQRKYGGLQLRHVEGDDSDEGGKVYPKNTKEFKKAKTEEEKRRMPPRKVISVMRAKDGKHHLSAAARPTLIMNEAESSRQKVSKYLVVFEETFVMRREDLQLSDVVSINLWQHKALKAATTKVKPVAQCRLTVGDIHVAMEKYHNEVVRRRQNMIIQKAKSASTERHKMNSKANAGTMLDFLGMRKGFDTGGNDNSEQHEVQDASLTAPAVQEFAMMKHISKRSRAKHSNAALAIQEEMAMLKREEEDTLKFFEAGSSDEFDSDSSFQDDDRANASDDESDQAANMEQLYGHVLVSFFPIRW